MKKKFYDPLLIKPGKSFKLSSIDPDDVGFTKLDKKEAAAELTKLNVKLDKLQELLYAESKSKILVVLQGMDTSGKDGAIREVFNGVNPQGVLVKSFKAPTDEELSRDYLCRVHKFVPAKGEIVIFNRSHYEDVLIVRVHNLIKKDVWQNRYAHITDFEQMLCEEGTIVLKFFFYISKDEQKERLQARIDDPNKHWKFRVTDLEERKFWPKYMEAYEDMIAKTTTKCAPWYVVPSNHKWFRNLLVASVLVDTLESLKMSYPKSDEKLKGIKVV